MTNEEIAVKLQEIIDRLPMNSSAFAVLAVVRKVFLIHEEEYLVEYLIPFAKDILARIG